MWFDQAVTGRTYAEIGIPSTVDRSFTLRQDDTITTIQAAYRTRWEVSRSNLAELAGEDIVDGRGPRPVWALQLQVLRELAQHAGHADILREQVLASRSPRNDSVAAGATERWERRLADAWATLDDHDVDRAADFRAVIDAIVAELPTDSPLASFERACAWDSTGHPDEAVPLYREALARGLDGYRARRAKIQLASSLRNLGHAAEGVELLSSELEAPHDELDDAVRAILALCLADLGREREGLSLALGALAPHLPRYQRSVTNDARLLGEPAEPG